MSTITKEFTKEQLQQIIETDHVQCGEASALARISLASLEADPVAWMVKDIDTGEKIIRSDRSCFEGSCQPLYTAPPAPVAVPDEMVISDDMNLFQKSFAQGHNACRAAMLQGGK